MSRSAMLPALSPQQVADAYGLSRRTIYRAIQRGELSAAKLCGRIRVSPGAIAEWISASTLGTQETVVRVSEQDLRGKTEGGASLRTAFEDWKREAE
jgi:excisionase family DNA binding protein